MATTRRKGRSEFPDDNYDSAGVSVCGGKYATSQPKEDVQFASPSWTSYSDDMKLFVEAKNPDDGSIMIRYTKNTAIINVMNTTIVLQKTSRGRTFTDSRFTGKRFSEDEILPDLIRWFGEVEGNRVMAQLRW
jgi:hypothetical protein